MKKVLVTLGVGLAVVVGTGVILAPVAPKAIAQIRAALVKNVDEPGRTPFVTRSAFLPNAGGCFGTSDCFNYSDGSTFALMDLRPIPAGKRWIVQSATGYQSGGISRIINIELGYPRGGLVFDGVKWTFGGPFSPGAVFGAALFSENLNVSFCPGEVPFLRIRGNPELGGYTVIVFNGYLIDATN